MIRTRAPYAAALAAALLAPAAGAQQAALPFGPGESCVYRASIGLGRIGRATMAVDSAAERGGKTTYLLRFDFRGRVGVAGVEDHTRSWLDPDALTSVRYTKRERTPVSRRDQDVRMDAEGGRWSDGARGGAMATRKPLDELSFLFFLRTLPLEDGAVYNLARHYDAARNPVVVRVLGRTRVRVPAGEIPAVEVEMRVRDAERYGREGVIRLAVSDDPRRLLLRMETAIAPVGRMTLALESRTASCGTGRMAQR